MRLGARSLTWQVVARFACCGVVAPMLAWAPTVSGRQAQEIPFLYKGTDGWRQRFAPEALREWAAAVRHHSPGAADESLRTIAGWSPTRVAGAIADLDALVELIRERRGHPNPGALLLNVRGYDDRLSEALGLLQLSPLAAAAYDVTGFLKRAAVLHTDIAIAQWATSKSADVWSESSGVSFQLGIANALVNWLNRTGQDRFVVLWYRATAALLHSHKEVLVQPTFLDSTLAATKDTPDTVGVLLMAGALRELLASPQMDLAPASPRRVSRQERLREAERFYRRALDMDPHVMEAAVRLSRVLLQLDRPEAASAVLRAVRIDGINQLAFFRDLFLGDAEEALGNFDAAWRAYQTALDMYPNAPSAALALSQIARRRGDRAAAVAPIQRMLQLAVGATDDPWTGYFVAGDGQRVMELLTQMREASQKDDR
jgi:tetratricopeptide (TPR) repeat protein